jgi:hypothetical protein
MAAYTSLAQHRRAQNRASQRAYRERKEKRLNDLESQLKKCESEKLALSQQCAALQKRCRQLEQERQWASKNDHSCPLHSISKGLDQPLLESGLGTPVHDDKLLQLGVEPAFFVSWELLTKR